QGRKRAPSYSLGTSWERALDSALVRLPSPIVNRRNGTLDRRSAPDRDRTGRGRVLVAAFRVVGSASRGCRVVQRHQARVLVDPRGVGRHGDRGLAEIRMT